MNRKMHSGSSRPDVTVIFKARKNWRLINVQHKFWQERLSCTTQWTKSIGRRFKLFSRVLKNRNHRRKRISSNLESKKQQVIYCIAWREQRTVQGHSSKRQLQGYHRVSMETMDWIVCICMVIRFNSQWCYGVMWCRKIPGNRPEYTNNERENLNCCCWVYFSVCLCLVPVPLYFLSLGMHRWQHCF